MVAFAGAGSYEVIVAIEHAINKSDVTVRPYRVCSITNRGPEAMIDSHFILSTCQRRADRQFLAPVNNDPRQLVIIF
jgi:hypothetical protein